MWNVTERDTFAGSILAGTVENYLRVAPIRSGDSVIIMNEVVLKQYIYCDLENKKGGTADSKVIDNQTLSVPCM